MDYSGVLETIWAVIQVRNNGGLVWGLAVQMKQTVEYILEMELF